MRLMLQLLACWLVAGVFHAPAQEPVPPPAGTPVIFDERELVRVYGKYGPLSPEERALLIQRRLLDFARDRSRSPEAVHPEDNSRGSRVMAGTLELMSITEGDAAAAGKSRHDLAVAYAAQMRTAIARYREEWSWQELVKGSLWALLATAILALWLFALRAGRRWLRAAVLRSARDGRLAVRIRKFELLSPLRLSSFLLTMVGLAYLLAIVISAQIYLTVVLRLFPGTAHIAAALASWLWSPVGWVWNGLIGYLPNLALILVVAVVTAYAIRFNRFLFNEIAEGRLTFSGFYPDWALPTSKLVTVSILALAGVVVFPYLPGARSPAFQGVSIFLGVLLSLGSTSAVANVVAGAILTYMRPFLPGDRVRIAETEGDVMEKNLLVTRIRTIKNVIITVPNASVLSSHIMNYSMSAKGDGLILNTTVSIGYDTPWREVHALLINAARSTRLILSEPPPFVMQTALNDFYAVYQINAYTSNANLMADIYAELHQNIQDKFAAAGVEIMSPHYTALRDGQQVVLPDSLRKNSLKSD